VSRNGRERVAITGAGGIIGSRLAADLDRDHDVVRVDRALADILNRAALETAFAGCTAVVHLAAGVLRDGSWEEVWDANLAGVRNVFDAALRTGCTRVIFGSSLHVIGMYEEEARPAIYEPGRGPVIGPDVPVRPGNPYAVTKACGEIIARFYADVHRMHVTCVRIGTMNVADSPRIPDAASSTRLRGLTDAERQARLAAKWFSHADLARLVRKILARDVAFSIVYGVGDNAGRFVDLEPGRELFDFWPRDGAKG
jgi:NAD+ dependent glucose-6-phosphate dehydrogenase